MDSLGLYDIYDYWYVPFWQTVYFKGITIGIIFVIGICIAFYFYKKMQKKRALNVWTLWHNALVALSEKQVNNKTFYAELTTILKSIATTQLQAPQGITDVELSLFLKHEKFPPAVIDVAPIVEQAYEYKFDPLYVNGVVQKKDVEKVLEALVAIKNMDQAKNNIS